MAAAGLLACALVTHPLPAAALELFGKSFFEGGGKDQTDSVVPDPTPYDVTFSVAGESGESGDGEKALGKELRTESILVTEQPNPPSGFIGLISRAKADRNLLLAALYNAGRYGGTVDVTLAGQDLDTVDLDPDRRIAHPVPVTVLVRPGPVFRFGSTKILLAGGGTENPADYDLVPGDIARSERILAADAKLVRAFGERGHPYARLVDQNVVADHGSGTLDVELFFDPGPVATFGPVHVEGAQKVEDDFIVRHANLPTGRTYDTRKLEQSADRLRKLGIFSRVTIEPGREPGPDGSVPVLITVAEGKMRVIGAGLTVDSENGLGIEGFWRHRNLFGRGERFGVEASIGRIGNATDIEQLEYRAGIAFAKPGIIGPASTFESRLSVVFENPDAYKRKAVNGEANLVYDIDDKQTVRGGLEVELSDIKDFLGTRQHILVGTPIEYVLDARDDRVDPARGYRVVAFAQPFYDLRQDVGFVRIGGAVSVYRAVDAAKRFVLAAKAGGGAIFGASNTEIAANRRFYAGGANSVRGYGFQQAGPAAADGTPTGGLFLVETSLEARVRVTESISLVPFLDAGGVFDNAASDFGDNLQFGAGIGLRYKTPIGPLRLDVAMPLNPGRGDDQFGLYLGLGHTF